MFTAKHVNAHPILQFILHISPQPLEQVAPHMLAHAVQAFLHPIQAFLHVLEHFSIHSFAHVPVHEWHPSEHVLLQSEHKYVIIIKHRQLSI